MKLTSIRLCNFRSFYGKTPEIVLAGETKRNTTIIHGNNGAGKTSFLNAFTWVLYEKFSAAFASVEQLVNKRAIAEANIGQAVECWVEVLWEHDNKRYRVKRECRVYKNETDFDAGKTQLFMQVAGDDGRWYPSPQHPEDVINQILPVSLHQYFFFDGERIEQIVRSDKKAEIAEATKIFLGVKVIDNSIKHLSEAKKTLENELKAVGDAETKQILRNRQKIEIEIEQITQRQTEIIQELEYQQTFKKETNNRLRELSAAKELQERRQVLENQKKSNQENLRQSKEALKKAISTRGYSVLLSSTTSQFREIIADLKQRGELTAGISQEFVQELLNSNRCICGAELYDGSHAHHNVSNLLNQTGSSTIQETTIRTFSQVAEIDKQATAFWEDVDREQVRISQLRASISQIEAELDNIQERLRKDPSEEIRSLQRRLDDIEKKITELNIEQGEKKQQITNLKTEVAELDKQIAKQRFNEERQALAQRRITATLDAIERLTEVKHRQEKQFRLQLEKRIQEIFNEISITPYIPKISDKYELTLVENTAGIEASVAASTGENQILSLSFVGSIIDKVREWSERKMLMVADSSTFPIVMDSPFGSLDETYRRQIAKIIPQLANQLIVLVSNTQWRGEVEIEMTKRIGREYVLTYYSSKLDCEEDVIEIARQQYPLVRQSPNEFEYTEILEVNREN
ncbi:AAA family ATPase [Gloeocapsopsis dulcis]|uniref:Nuclease SbcCD subunit C n=1 Tax=Gloeocapsopsis dulcis AAB1 = 1H9 TaxID=1433147 RepID=A0A6N8FZP4_9CHRO|nr:AAA family ATPase [Gloeocapsopsis dulcis]MUL38630.1 ATP-binding protein [Gloeocapsopsis dulcis AAB1 = 1H9]WNN88663.1 AAA family ATPase [Gloeocapsopsis dulcis]